MDRLFRQAWTVSKLFLYTLSAALLLTAAMAHPNLLAFVLHKTQMFSTTTLNFISIFRTALFTSGILFFAITHFILNNSSKKTKEGIMTSIATTILILLLLIFFETAVRLIAPQTTLTAISSISPRIYTTSNPISWTLKPNTTDRHCTGEFCVRYTINSRSLRSKEYTLEKPKNTTRILVLGDSFTFGFGVEDNETYPAVLEQLLNKNHLVEVWNAGVSGYSPDAYYLFLKENIAKIKPDIVLVGFYAGNDLIDDSCYNKNSLNEEGLPTTVTSKIFEVKNNQLILRNQKNNPYQTTFTKYVDIILSRWSHGYILLKTTISPSVSASQENTPFLLKNPPKKLVHYLERTKKILLTIQRLSIANNANFSIVIIPSRTQANKNDWSYVKKQFKEYEPQQNLIQQELTEWCKTNNLNCIDLLPEFLASKEQLYYTITDSHFNRQGHKLTADILAEQLTKQHVIR